MVAISVFCTKYCAQFFVRILYEALLLYIHAITNFTLDIFNRSQSVAALWLSEMFQASCMAAFRSLGFLPMRLACCHSSRVKLRGLQIFIAHTVLYSHSCSMKSPLETYSLQYRDAFHFPCSHQSWRLVKALFREAFAVWAKGRVRRMVGRSSLIS